MERAIAFGGRDLKDFKKMFEEWKRIGKPKRFHYDSTTGKGRAISEYEHKMDEAHCASGPTGLCLLNILLYVLELLNNQMDSL